jgi:uncharacterized membrane protein
MTTVLVVGAAATWAMVGLIWIVQVVHYPMLAEFSAISPVTAAVDHQRRISWVVGPLMAAEGITALVLLVDRPATMGVASAWMAASLLGVALLSTVLVQVPLHSRLAAGHDVVAARRLISTNWVRTFAWTARGVVLAAVLVTT